MKFLIWGTGNIATQIYKNGVNGILMGFIETQKSKEVWEEYQVFDAETIPCDYDYIIVANTYSDEIYDVCNRKGMEITKIAFLKRGKNTCFNADRRIREILGEKNYVNYALEYGEWKNTFFEDDLIKWSSLNRRESFVIDKKALRPFLLDKFETNGGGGVSTYFQHDLWAAKHIISNGTKEHFDIGSRVDGFVTHLLAAGIKVNMIDIRPFPGVEKVENLSCIVDDATMMSQIEDNSLMSLSAISSLEHFGLGRYGDPIDPEACFKCFAQMQKKMKDGGKLYLSVPVGKERVVFNAHRIFYAGTVVSCFAELKLIEYSVVANKEIEHNVDINKYDGYDSGYVMGLFYFMKG